MSTPGGSIDSMPGFQTTPFVPIPLLEFRVRVLALYEPPLMSRSAWGNMRRALDLVAELLGADATTADLTMSAVAQFVKARHGVENPNTTRTWLSRISAACNIALAEGWIRFNPVKIRRRWVRSVTPKAPRVHSREEIARVLTLAAAEAGGADGLGRLAGPPAAHAGLSRCLHRDPPDRGADSADPRRRRRQAIDLPHGTRRQRAQDRGFGNAGADRRGPGSDPGTLDRGSFVPDHRRFAWPWPAKLPFPQSGKLGSTPGTLAVPQFVPLGRLDRRNPRNTALATACRGSPGALAFLGSPSSRFATVGPRTRNTGDFPTSRSRRVAAHNHENFSGLPSRGTGEPPPDGNARQLRTGRPCPRTGRAPTAGR